MSEQRPNVFPKNTNVPATEPTMPKISVDADYTAKRMIVAEEVYNNAGVNEEFGDAVEQMRRRTEEQVKRRNEALQANIDMTKNYETQYNTIANAPKPEQPKYQQSITAPTPKPVIQQYAPSQDSYIQHLSQPQYNSSFDLLPLPSEGKLYRGKRPNLKVAYMTTADENILSSPNLLSSGDFLEILMNRKILESDIRYRDLHVGDRNAIMLWIRATSYGEMYPVTLFDENEVPFETEINLNDLKVKKLGAEPDSEGYFDFLLPVIKKNIKFKLLTVGDVEDIEKKLVKEKEEGIPVNNLNTYSLERQIIEVEGERDKNYIRDFVQSLRVRDAKELRTYITKIESGIELEINVGTPGGGSIKTFLPLNYRFFWPDASL